MSALNSYLFVFAAKPEYVRIEDIGGVETANASMIGPHNEGTVVTLICISGGGKPVAKLNWYNNSAPLEGKSETALKPYIFCASLMNNRIERVLLTSRLTQIIPGILCSVWCIQIM